MSALVLEVVSEVLASFCFGGSVPIIRKQTTWKRVNSWTSMNPRQTEHDVVKEVNERCPPFARRPRSFEETRIAQDFVIWEDSVSYNDDDSQSLPVSYSSGSVYRPANSHTWVNASLPDRTNLPETRRMSEEDIKALDLMMAGSTRYSIAYASDNTFNEDDEKDNVQRGSVPLSKVGYYSEERSVLFSRSTSIRADPCKSRARIQGPRPPLVDITSEKIPAPIAKLNQTNFNVQPAPGSPMLTLTVGRTKPSFCSSPFHRMTTVADECENSNSAASDNISEASTEYSDENALPSKSAPRMETSLFHVSPYRILSPEQSGEWNFTGKDSDSESYGDENQSPDELHTRRNPKEYIITASSSSPYSETSKGKSHRRCRSVALSPSIAPPPKKSRGKIFSTGVQYSRSQPKDNIPWHRRSVHAGLTVGVPACYVDGNNPEPPARASRGMTSRIVGVCAPARLFTPIESSGIEGFWGDEN